MIYISELANEEIIEYLKKKDEVKIVESTDLVYEEVSAHPDIYMCSLGDRIIFAEEDELGYKYPENCAFNAACTGKFFIGNLKHIAPRLLKEAEAMVRIDVKQGYTKCSTAVIDEDSIITSDRGIASKCSPHMNVLLISESTKDHPLIALKGFPYGFIGGTCGKIDDEIVFNGRISDHPDHMAIKKFIEERSLKIKEFDWPLEDIGSIIR